MPELEGKECRRNQGHTCNECDELSSAPLRDKFSRRNILRPLHSFRCHLEGPGNNKSDRETSNYGRHKHLHDPGRRFEGREENGPGLNQQPSDNSVGDGDFVNVATLQLGEEVAQVHRGRSQLPFITRNSCTGASTNLQPQTITFCLLHFLKPFIHGIGCNRFHKRKRIMLFAAGRVIFENRGDKAGLELRI